MKIELLSTGGFRSLAPIKFPVVVEAEKYEGGYRVTRIELQKHIPPHHHDYMIGMYTFHPEEVRRDMVCNHGNKAFVGKNWGTKPDGKYTEAIFYCPDCSETVVKRIDHVHMDTPELRALFAVKKTVEPKVEKYYRLSPYKQGFAAGFLVVAIPVVLKILEII